MMLVDKPLDWTSFDVVKKMRSRLQNALKIKKIKVGHAGTLDPLATGLVIVCTGKATKKIERLMGQEKVYEAWVKFGATTPSFDLETEIDQEFPWAHIDADAIKAAFGRFLGEQPQIPPHYSAVKIKGQRAYRMIRNGEEFEINARNVMFHELELLNFDRQEAFIRIRCSKGTYIRSFARDLGQALNSGAFLTGLRRTAIGPVSVEDAFSIADYDQQIDGLKERWLKEGWL